MKRPEDPQGTAGDQRQALNGRRKSDQDREAKSRPVYEVWALFKIIRCLRGIEKGVATAVVSVAWEEGDPRLTFVPPAPDPDRDPKLPPRRFTNRISAREIAALVGCDVAPRSVQKVIATFETVGFFTVHRKALPDGHNLPNAIELNLERLLEMGSKERPNAWIPHVKRRGEGYAGERNPPGPHTARLETARKAAGLPSDDRLVRRLRALTKKADRVDARLPLREKEFDKYRAAQTTRLAELEAELAQLAKLAPPGSGGPEGDSAPASAAPVQVPANTAPVGEHRALARAQPVIGGELLDDDERSEDVAASLGAIARRLDAEILDILVAFPDLARLGSMVVRARNRTDTAVALLGASARMHGRSIEDVQAALTRVVYKLHRGDYPRLATLDPTERDLDLLKLARAFIRDQWAITDCAPLPTSIVGEPLGLREPSEADIAYLCRELGVSRVDLAKKRARYDGELAELGAIGVTLRRCATGAPSTEAAGVFERLAGEIENWDPLDHRAYGMRSSAANRIRGATETGRYSGETAEALGTAAAEVLVGEQSAVVVPQLEAAREAPSAPGPRIAVTPDVQADFDRAVQQTRALSPATFDQWFGGVQFDGLTDSVLLLRVQNEFVLEWVKSNFLPTLTDKIRELTGWSVQVAWTVDQNLDAPIASRAQMPPVRPRPLPAKPLPPT